MQFSAKWSLYRNRIIGLNFHLWMGRGALALDERAEDGPLWCLLHWEAAPLWGGPLTRGSLGCCSDWDGSVLG